MNPFETHHFSHSSPKKKLKKNLNIERKVINRKKKIKKRLKYPYYTSSFKKNNFPIPKQYINQIICSDNILILKKIPDHTIDLIFTSPPYNFGLQYSESDDTHLWTDYFQKLSAVLIQCIRIIKYSGRIIINIQPLFSDYIPVHHILSHFLINQGMIWKGEILWEKNHYNCKYTSWGSWKSPASPYLKYTWEFLEIFCKGNLKKEGNKNNIDIQSEDFKQWTYAKWSIAPERDMKKYNHPAMFPMELARRVIQLFSYKKDIILDPFNGAGTTTCAAYQLQRDYLGIDISKEYCNTAKKRIHSLQYHRHLF